MRRPIYCILSVYAVFAFLNPTMLQAQGYSATVHQAWTAHVNNEETSVFKNGDDLKSTADVSVVHTFPNGKWLWFWVTLTDDEGTIVDQGFDAVWAEPNTSVRFGPNQLILEYTVPADSQSTHYLASIDIFYSISGGDPDVFEESNIQVYGQIHTYQRPLYNPGGQ